MDKEGLTERETVGQWRTVYYENSVCEIVAKVCKKCGEAKTLDDFGKHNSALGGRRPDCKSCVNKRDSDKRRKAGKPEKKRPKLEEIGGIIGKICSSCDEWKTLGDYYEKPEGLGGRSSECKPCDIVRGRKYYEENRERELERSRKYYEENKDQYSEKARIRYAENKEQILEACRKWKEANKERVKENTRKWREANPERVDSYGRKWRENNIEKVRERRRKQYYENYDYYAKHREENKEYYRDYYRKWYDANKESIIKRTRNWARNNPDKVAVKDQRRKALKRYLPHTLTSEQYERTLKHFDGCALTGIAEKLDMDHAVPLSVGHGGTTFENCYPLSMRLNRSKSDRNIFEWFEANRQRFELSQERFDNLIAYLASANAMTVEGYRDHVYWCHANPRNINELEAN